MKSGCRYVRAIKQSINKLQQSQSSLHLSLAQMIAGYSHHTNLKVGSAMIAMREGNPLAMFYTADGFFMVEEILSLHWCIGYWCPPMLDLNYGIVPNLGRRSGSERKRIFNTFTIPMVKRRKTMYLIVNEPVQNNTSFYV